MAMVQGGGDSAYAADLAGLMRGHADAEQAVAMVAYMPDQFVFLGIRTLWAMPEREFHYSAMMWRRARRSCAWRIRSCWNS